MPGAISRSSIDGQRTMRHTTRMAPTMRTDWLRRRGRDVALFSGLFFSAFHAPFAATPGERRLFLSSLTKQIYFTGVQALTPISLIALVIGAIVIIQTIQQLPRVGAEGMIGSVLVIVIVREVGPLLITVILIGRSATAITTEIAEMRVNGQFLNLLTVGVNPQIYLFAPRVWGMIVSLFVLKTFFIASALVGGFIMARIATYVNFSFLFASFFQTLGLADFVSMVLKSFFIGSFVSIIAVREGLKVVEASTEIPQATSRTVLNAIFYALLIDITFATLNYAVL